MLTTSSPLISIFILSALCTYNHCFPCLFSFNTPYITGNDILLTTYTYIMGTHPSLQHIFISLVIVLDGNTCTIFRGFLSGLPVLSIFLYFFLWWIFKWMSQFLFWIDILHFSLESQGGKQAFMRDTVTTTATQHPSNHEIYSKHNLYFSMFWSKKNCPKNASQA